MTLDLLAITAHPDDAEITCGGTMIKMADRGYRVGIIDLTAGEMGTLGSSESRLQEANEAARIMGLAHRENLGLSDSALHATQENRLKLAEVIRRLKPRTVILPLGDKQRHPDHRIAALLGYDGCFLSGLSRINLDGVPHRPDKILYTSSFIETKHSFFVDISDQLERKLAAVAAYKTQFDGSEQSRKIFKPGHDITDLITIYCRKYGMEVGVKYAEPFVVSEPMLIDDPTVLPVKSI